MLPLNRTYWCALSVLLSFNLFVIPARGEEPTLTSVFTEKNDAHKQKEAGVKWTAKELGEAIFVKPIMVKRGAKNPKEPMIVEGTVMHRGPGIDDFDDEKYIRSASGDEPVIEWEAYKQRLIKKMAKDWKLSDPDKEWDIESKWVEAQFLNHIAPNISAPETHLMSEFDPSSLSDKDREKIEKKVKKVIKEYDLDPATASEKLFKAEAYRMSAHEALGKSIVKPSYACGSYGNLPWTDDNWLDIYGEYLSDLIRNPDDTSRRGWVIDKLVNKPHQAIAQKAIKLKQEVRVHILNGHVVKGATFIRYNHVDDMLPTEEVRRIENAVEEYFLSNLRKEGKGFEKFNATPDVAIGPDGRFYIIDLNAGIDSGFYHPALDIFTSNLVTKQLTGKSTPFLDQWEEYKKIPMGKEKVEAFRELRRSYPKFITSEYNQHAQIWDRVTNHYYDLLKANPTNENLEIALLDFRAGGLKDIDLWAKFLNEAQNLIRGEDGKRLKIPKEHRQLWVDHLNKLDEDYETILDGKRVRVTEDDQSKQTRKHLASIAGTCPLSKLARKRPDRAE